MTIYINPDDQESHYPDPPETQENKILHCTHRNGDCSSAWKEKYNGIACDLCGLFYPDNGNYFSGYDEPGSETCSHCGKELEDFSDLGCEYCDARYFDHYPNLENDCA